MKEDSLEGYPLPEIDIEKEKTEAQREAIFKSAENIKKRTLLDEVVPAVQKALVAFVPIEEAKYGYPALTSRADIPPSDLDKDQILKRRSELLAESESIVESINQIISLITQKAEELGSKEIYVLQEVSTDIASITESCAEKQQRLEKVSLEISILDNQYAQKALSDNGFSDVSEVNGRISEINDEIQVLYDQRKQISRSFFNRAANNLGLKKDVREITQQVKELNSKQYALSELQDIESRTTYVANIEYSKRSELSNGLHEVVAATVNELLGVIGEELRQAGQEKEVVPLTQEALIVITSTFIDGQIGEDLAKLPDDLQQKVSDLLNEAATCSIIVQQRFYGSEDELAENKRMHEKGMELHERIQTLMQEVHTQTKTIGGVYQLLNGFLYLQYSVHEQFQKCNELVQRFPKIKSFGGAADSFLPALTVLEKSMKNANLLHYSGKLKTNSQLAEMKNLLRRSEEEREFNESFDKLELSYWDAYRDSPQVVSRVNAEQIKEVDTYLADSTISKLITQHKHTDKALELGRRLLHFRDTKAVPINIMNAFRESGPSGGYMFIDTGTSPEKTLLYEYIKSLNGEELAAVTELGIPPLNEIIELIKDNSETFSQRKIRDVNTGEYVNNPAFSNIESKLAEMAKYYFDTKVESMQLFATRLLVQLRGVDISFFYPYLAELFATQGTDMQEAIFDLAESRLSAPNSEPNVAHIILAAYPTLDAYAQQRVKKGAPEIFRICLENDLSEDQLRTMCELLEREESCTKKVISFIRQLRALDGVYFSFESKSIDAYFQLGQLEGMADLIGELAVNGYYFSTGDAPILPNVLAAKDNILSSIQTIMESFPDFRYSIFKNYQYSAQTSAVDTNYVYDPYQVLVAQMSKEYLFNSLRMLSSEEDGLPRQFTDGLMWSLRSDIKDQSAGSGEITEQELNVFQSSLQELINTVQEKSGPLYEHRSFYQDNRCLQFLARNPDKIDDLLSLGREGLLLNAHLTNFYIDNLDKLLSIPAEKRGSYAEVLAKVSHSPSQEIQRIKQQLLEQLILTDDPLRDYNLIEQIFIRNNLPTVGKVFKIFDILHPQKVFESKMNPDLTSPYLVAASERKRQYTLYNDLIKVHLGSGNRSLRDYMRSIQEGEQILPILEEKGLQGLEEDERCKLASFINVLTTLYNNSQLGRGLDTQFEAREELKQRDILNGIKNIIASLEVEPDQSISDRLAEMFLRPMGIQSFAEGLEKMKEVKQCAHDRSLGIVEHGENRLSLKVGDLIKGVYSSYISIILQNGSVSKEFLGASSDSDLTPFDTDLSMVTEADAELSFEKTISTSLAPTYGDLLFVVKNRGQMQVTTKENVHEYDPDKLELFHTGVLGERHYGIRTGFPTTEIDFMIATSQLAKDGSTLERIYQEIAQNGFYIPVADTVGRIIFTPEMYAKYRKTFNGIPLFEGDPIDFKPTDTQDAHYEEVRAIATQVEGDSRRIEELYIKIKNVINEVLQQEGIVLKDKYDHGLLGAELLDIGSTGRHTNKIGDFDFDLTLKLDDADMVKAPIIASKIIERLKPEKNDSHSELDRGYYQLRAINSEGIEGLPDVDIGITSKSELAVYGSHDAIADKLASLRREQGEEAYGQVVANIILAKKKLNEAGAYKKVEHGGFGGIGVENWILSNKGNITEACTSFWDAAHEGERQLSFDDFKEQYAIFDAGINIKYLSHDNFIKNMKQQGYEAMLVAIKDFLNEGEEELI